MAKMTGKRRLGSEDIRLSFARFPQVMEVPHLLDIQFKSYERFLQYQVPLEKRNPNIGLAAIFRSVFPIRSANAQGNVTLEYLDYHFGLPEFEPEECRMRDKTYAAPLRVNMQIVVRDPDTGKTVEIRKDNEPLYMGDIPLMTENGTFVINGTDRVVVSQLHRSPGVIFDHDRGKNTANKLLHQARIIPYRGSWLDFEFDVAGLVYMRIDRRRKLPVTTLLRALEYSTEEILDLFFDNDVFTPLPRKKYSLKLVINRLRGQVLPFPVKNKSGRVLVPSGRRISPAHLATMEKAKLKTLEVGAEFLHGRVLAKNIVDKKTGEVVFEANTIIDEEVLDRLRALGVKKIETIYTNDLDRGPFISDTLREDENQNTNDALTAIFRVMRPGTPPTLEFSRELFNSLFFDVDRYTLSPVGRSKLNRRLGISERTGQVTLAREDIVETVKMLVAIRNGKGQVDDIDHLGNRRVRSVGEMMENQFRLGLIRIERAVRERLTQVEQEPELHAKDLVNAKPIVGAMQEFFSSSQLSQFMDQTNPLAEITHKRRVSALGPGGLTRERAGFEVRDVHPTHYGRVCPIETPEGPNIGLINSLALYARTNDLGFIETPYRRVVGGKVTDEIDYLSAMDEMDYVIAQASSKLNKQGAFVDELVPARHGNESILAIPRDVDYIDVSPQQIVSVAASLVPFLEHDDANRALMGSNMQRQAVPVLQAKSPLVGTGMENKAARDAGACVIARRSGVVENVDAGRITIRAAEGEIKEEEQVVDIYSLVKYSRSNQNTCINQKPIVKPGESVKAGQVIADGASVYRGELALGRNMRIAFMPWNGYNFEDSILISERVVKDDTLTSIHIQEIKCVARETKAGKEEITSDIPNISEAARAKLDESGIIYIGAEVGPGDILAGKVTPKGDTVITPEKKLLQAIFGEKAEDVKDTSRRVPSGTYGTVVDVQVFVREKDEKGSDPRVTAIDQELLEKLRKDLDEEYDIIKRATLSRLRKLLSGKVVSKGAGIKSGEKLSAKTARELKEEGWKKLRFKDDALNKKIDESFKRLRAYQKELEKRYKNQENKITSVDELGSNELKVVKVFLAVKRQVRAGDKMAGRHGNKGVISAVRAVEDMPFTEDGEPVDIVLNPLGVPSRMNVGQVLETHLGLAAKGIGNKINKMMEREESRQKIRSFVKEVYKLAEQNHLDVDAIKEEAFADLVERLRDGLPISTPVFDGCSEEKVRALLKLADCPEDGQMDLYDGRTGDKYDSPVTVGYMYMMKLNHLVDEKMHARSTGHYSLVTQQPLGGKAQEGGQRFGEMEVWALEAYGASHILQEMLTMKSDDMHGRRKIFEQIIERDHAQADVSVPESFRVLMREIRALGLNIELLEEEAGADFSGGS